MLYKYRNKIIVKHVLFQDKNTIYSTNSYFWSNFFTTKQKRDKINKKFDDKVRDKKYWQDKYRGYPKKQKLRDTLKGVKYEKQNIYKP